MAGAGFENNIVYSDAPDFSGVSNPSITNTILGDNQVWLGRTASIPGQSQIDVMTLIAGAGITLTRGGAGVPGTPGTLTISSSSGGTSVDSFAMQTGTSPVVPDANGLVTFNGAAVAAGTNPVRTNGTGANTMQLQVQLAGSGASSDPTQVGLSFYNLADFVVDPNGFVSLANPPINPSSTTVLFEDFLFWSNSSSQGPGDFIPWVQGSGWTNTNESNHPGIMHSLTANTSSYISSSNAVANLGIAVGDYAITLEMMVRLNQLSSANPDFTFCIGLCNNGTEIPTSNSVDGIYFKYNHAVNSGNWVIESHNGASFTTTNTNTTVDTNWHRYKIVINSAGNSARFYVDNVEVSGSPITTNLPTTDQLLLIAMRNNSGANVKTYDTDYWYLKLDYTR